jgi:Tol biopolymer transport system component
MKPEIFAPEAFKKAAAEMHSVCEFSPDGREVYWSPMPSSMGSWPGIYFMKFENGKWTEPQQPSFTIGYRDHSPALSPDGKRLFFNRQDDIDKPTQKWNIYYVERTAVREL